MDAGLDTGDMLLKETVALEEKETGGSLFDKLSEVGCAASDQNAGGSGERNRNSPKTAGRKPDAVRGNADKKAGRNRLESGCKKNRVPDPRPESVARAPYARYRGKTLKIWEDAAG